MHPHTARGASPQSDRLAMMVSTAEADLAALGGQPSIAGLKGPVIAGEVFQVNWQ